MAAGALSFRHFILGLLNQQSMSGYDIKRLLKSLNWLVDGPSFGNIYSTLHALLEDGLVTVELVPQRNKPPRKVYSITEMGEQTLHRWADQSVVPNASLRAFVMRLILGSDFSPESLFAQLQQRHAQVDAHRCALEKRGANVDDNTELGRLAVDYGLALATAELDWLESMLIRLSQHTLPVDLVRHD
jgi:DNA-binding PadR family transcriptional regulator